MATKVAKLTTSLVRSKSGFALVFFLCALFVLMIRFHWLKGGTDNGLFYYAARALISGHNLYDREWVFREWVRDGSPTSLNPHSFSGYINPPSLAFFYVPVLLSPPKFAYFGIVALNCIAALYVAFALPKSSPNFTKTKSLLFAVGVLIVPSVFEIIQFGQSSLIAFALLAGGLLAFSRHRPAIGGALLGLSLSKFTLTLPFILYLALCRRWKAFGSAALAFTVLNLVLILPAGIPRTLQTYKALLSAESGENTSYDPMANVYKYRPDLIINARRASAIILGGERSKVAVLNWVLSALIVGALVFLRVSGRLKGEPFSHPLEAPLLMIASLLLFYHRHYDLAGTLFAIFGLVDYGLQRPESRNRLWKIATALSILLACPVFFQLKNPLTTLHPQVGLIFTHYYASFELCVLFVLIWTICYRGGAEQEVAAAPS